MENKKIDTEMIRRLEQSDLTRPENKKEIFNLIETLYTLNIEQAEQIQSLKDEINRLKGEKGKPIFNEKKKELEGPSENKGEMKDKSKREWQKSSKKEKVKIDREEIVKLDKTGLPNDIEFKGYEEKIVQNIIIKTDNVLYRLEKYYSASEKKTYTAQVDDSIKGTEFGAETKALISTLYYENRVTENKITSFLNANGVHISEGTVSNILIKDQSEQLTKVKNEILEAGLSSEIYQQIDDTGLKIGKRSGYATIVCNERYSVYFINASKSRETIRSFLPAFLLSLFVVLVCDNAPQFKKLAKRLALCWIHEERHYKKLMPILECHKTELARVRSEIWGYYRKLAAYKKTPTEGQKILLAEEFDVLFGQETIYDDLNKRLKLTLEKKCELLTVLDYPNIPLHNNLSENGVREMVIKRKISGGVETEEGRKAWENNMSILATCKKLGISFFEFMKGIHSKNLTINLPSLIAHYPSPSLNH